VDLQHNLPYFGNEPIHTTTGPNSLEALMTIDAHIPMAPGALPVLGHVVRLVRDPLGFIRSLPAHGDLVRFRLGPRTVVMVCDPALVRQVLLDDRTFDKGGLPYERTREITGDGLVVCPHVQHRRQRRLCQPAFHHTRLPGYSHAMTASASRTAASWRDGQTIDVTGEMLRLATRCAVETMFASTALTAQEMGQAIDDVTTVLDGIFRRSVSPAPLLRLPLPANRNYQRALDRVRRTAADFIAARRADRTDHGDLLSALVAARDPDGPHTASGFSEQELIDQIVTFYLASSETTAVTVAWALSLLAHHPDIQHRVQAEVDRVLNGTPATHTHLQALELSSQVITETLRLYPPAWMLTRLTTHDTELAGTQLPAGTDIAYSPYLTHHHADRYADPDRFDPDRWIGNRPNHTTFLPFGAGARKCIGDRFALAEATLTLATITARWQLRPVRRGPLRPVVRTFLTPRNTHLRLTARRHTTSTPKLEAVPTNTAEPA
jgi:cytochrome P450